MSRRSTWTHASCSPIRHGRGGAASQQPMRRPSESTTGSPSSLVNEVRCGEGRMSSTVSEGRHRRAPRGGDDDRPLQQDRVLDHDVDEPIVGPRRIVEFQGIVRRSLAAKQVARGQLHRSQQSDQRGAVGRVDQVFDDDRLGTAVADQAEGVARGPAGGVVVDGDGGHGWYGKMAWTLRAALPVKKMGTWVDVMPERQACARAGFLVNGRNLRTRPGSCPPGSSGP